MVGTSILVDHIHGGEALKALVRGFLLLRFKQVDHKVNR